jgi:hypothetical protein
MENQITLKQAIESFGIKNIRIFGPGQKVGDIHINEVIQRAEFYICQERYKFKDNYKMSLESVDKTAHKENFYISDMESLIRNGVYQIYVMNIDGYKPVNPDVVLKSVRPGLLKFTRKN